MMTGIDPRYIPKEYTERCAKGELGGVVLVFLNGKDLEEMEAKRDDVIRYVKRLKKKYEKRSKPCA